MWHDIIKKVSDEYEEAVPDRSQTWVASQMSKGEELPQILQQSNVVCWLV